MCLLVVVWHLDDSAPLVAGANRDERLDRPATAVTVLKARSPRILGGRDELAGGTWLAVNEHGVVAALTNRPSGEGRDPTKRSRGELPLFLAEHASAQQAVEQFLRHFKPVEYNPAWMLVGDRDSLYSLDMSGDEATAQPLGAGVHILENLPPGTESPKVAHVRDLIGLVGRGGLRGEALTGRIKSSLGDHSLPPGVGHRGERPVDTLAACVHTEEYGTRSSVVLRVPARSGALPRLEVADGHPCTSSFVDHSALWTEAG
jgi:uncharacterized protein with NRDE domain